jgi:pyrimidine-nucleoside phosphorylase
MDAFEMGMVSVELGAGRKAKEDSVDPAAGFVLHKKIGDTVETGETFATLHTNKKEVLKQQKME